MQKFFELIIILLLSNSIASGQYIPIVEEGKFWIYLNYDTSNLDFPDPVSGHAITFLGDTLINSVSYKKVLRLNLKGTHDCELSNLPCWDFDLPYQTETKVLYGFIREDTSEKKIYYLMNSIAGKEDVLFDFSLSVGDTVNNYVYESIRASSTNLYPGGIVDSIKTIDTHGRLRNSFFTYGFYSIIGLPYETEVVFSEGLGFKDYGLFYTPQSEFVDYCEGGIEKCNLILSNITFEPALEIKVFPNPSTDLFQIESEEELKKIKAYSIFGQLIKESHLKNRIDLSDVKNGIYILEIITSSRERTIKRVIKKS